MSKALERVTVIGSHFLPGQEIVVGQCARGTIEKTQMITGCDLRHAVQTHADGAGGFEAEVSLAAFLQYGGRLERNCLVAICEVAAGRSVGETLLAAVPVTWNASAEVPDRPGLEVLRFSDVRNDPNARRATVRGRGFAPGAAVNLTQCPRAGDLGVAAGDCLYGGPTATADASGGFTVAMRVFRLFQRSSGELIDCSTSPDCVIAHVWPKKHGARMAWTALRVPAPRR